MFNIILGSKRKINNKISFPNYCDEWINEIDMPSMLFLYCFLRINQMYIAGSYCFRVKEYIETFSYNKKYVQNNKIKIIDNINNLFEKLYSYNLITCSVHIQSLEDIISLPYNSVNYDFEDGYYTLVEYDVIQKILNAKSGLKKDLLFYFMLFLNNRARNSSGYTSYEDMRSVINSAETINKYLSWFKENEIFDYYSTNHKLDASGVPKRGNTVIAKWENRSLIDDIRLSDKPGTGSKAEIKKLNFMFADDEYFIKCEELLKVEYGLTNNFLLLRLWNELPFGFTWKSLYKYLNSKLNIEFFNIDDEGEKEINKVKIVNKIVNIAKTQRNDVLQGDKDIIDGNAVLVGKHKDNKVNHHSGIWGEPQAEKQNEEDEKLKLNYFDSVSIGEEDFDDDDVFLKNFDNIIF